LHTHASFLLSLCYSGPHRDLHSFPTRRSSDLAARRLEHDPVAILLAAREPGATAFATPGLPELRLEGLQSDEAKALLSARAPPLDRKSTRMNSSHVAISYAVFCLKKKKLFS